MAYQIVLGNIKKYSFTKTNMFPKTWKRITIEGGMQRGTISC